jgi:hypothetical protein
MRDFRIQEDSFRVERKEKHFQFTIISRWSICDRSITTNKVCWDKDEAELSGELDYFVFSSYDRASGGQWDCKIRGAPTMT